MRGFGSPPEEWVDKPLTKSQIKEIKSHANPPNGCILDQHIIPTLERDLRALLAELKRRGEKLSE